MSLYKSFNMDHAILYGLEEAIMINYMQFWINHNFKHQKNFRENRTWIYQTQEELSQHFPFWNRLKIQRIMSSLEKQGVLLKDNFNRISYDRTTWYAFKNEEQFLAIQCSEINIGNNNSEQPIPVYKTIYKNKTTSLPPPNKKEKQKPKKGGGSFSTINKIDTSKPIYPCLVNVKIPEDEKIRLCKYPEDIVAKAVAVTSEDGFVPNKTLEHALFHYCMHPEQAILSRKKQLHLDVLSVNETSKHNVYYQTLIYRVARPSWPGIMNEILFHLLFFNSLRP